MRNTVIFFLIMLEIQLTPTFSQPFTAYSDSVKLKIEMDSIWTASDYVTFSMENISSKSIWVTKNSLDGYTINGEYQWIDPAEAGIKGVFWEIAGTNKKRCQQLLSIKSEGTIIKMVSDGCQPILVFEGTKHSEVVPFLFYLLKPKEKRIIYATSRVYNRSLPKNRDVSVRNYPYARLVMRQNAQEVKRRFFEGTIYESSLDSTIIFNGEICSQFIPLSTVATEYDDISKMNFQNKIDRSPCKVY